MKTILTYGTYDLLHKGHVLLLQRARALGDRLIVGLSTDEFNEIKGKRCFYSYEERELILNSIRYVDLVIPEDNWEQKPTDIQTHGVDIFVMGDDWKGKFDYLTDYCEVVYLPRTENISTTEIIEEIGKRGGDLR
jgi:glycerol-3-phosphate cytidylyltransferase